MSTQNRTALLQAAIAEGQRIGNLNVLLTNAIAQHVGLSATEYECYSLLLDEGPMTAGKLALRCGITTGGLTGLVDRLEKLGFVSRSADPADRRRVIVTARANKKLQEKLQTLYGPMGRDIRALNEQYTDEQLALIVSHYQKLNAAMEASIARLGAK